MSVNNKCGGKKGFMQEGLEGQLGGSEKGGGHRGRGIL